LSTVRLASQLLAGWLGAAIVLAAPAFAEDAPRRVGSLNYVSGEVSYVLRAEPGEPNGSDAENWLQADFDQPVCQDMSLKTGAMARARVRIGPDAIQMSDDTRLNMLNLTDQLIEASIRYGRIYLQLNKPSRAKVSSSRCRAVRCGCCNRALTTSKPARAISRLGLSSLKEKPVLSGVPPTCRSAPGKRSKSPAIIPPSPLP
jgi:hypothetical protein